MDLIDAVRGADARHGLFRHGATVLVAVSGGPDSVAMAYALAGYAPERGLRLHWAHLDHGLREASARDAGFVAALALAAGAPLVRGRVDLAPFALRLGRGLEHAARVAGTDPTMPSGSRRGACRSRTLPTDASRRWCGRSFRSGGATSRRS